MGSQRKHRRTLSILAHINAIPKEMKGSICCVSCDILTLFWSEDCRFASTEKHIRAAPSPALYEASDWLQAYKAIPNDWTVGLYRKLVAWNSFHLFSPRKTSTLSHHCEELEPTCSSNSLESTWCETNRNTVSTHGTKIESRPGLFLAWHIV